MGRNLEQEGEVPASSPDAYLVRRQISRGAKFARFQGKLTIPCAVCTEISQYQQQSKNYTYNLSTKKIVHTRRGLINC